MAALWRRLVADRLHNYILRNIIGRPFYNTELVLCITEIISNQGSVHGYLYIEATN